MKEEIAHRSLTTGPVEHVGPKAAPVIGRQHPRGSDEGPILLIKESQRGKPYGGVSSLHKKNKQLFTDK